MDDQYAHMMPRTEAATLVAAQSEKIEDVKKDIVTLRESRSEGDGARRHVTDTKTLITTSVAAIMLLIALATFFLKTSSGPAPSAPQVIYVPAPPNTMLPSTPPQPVPR